MIKCSSFLIRMGPDEAISLKFQCRKLLVKQVLFIFGLGKGLVDQDLAIDLFFLIF